MKAQIINFDQYKSKKTKAQIKTKKQTQKEIVATKGFAEIYLEVLDDVLGEWQAAAVKNRLSEYIFSKLPEYVRGKPSSDYINDLNVISTLELKLKMQVGIFYPGSTSHNPIGWMAAFYANDGVFVTPSDLASEATARALNVVMFVSFFDTLKTLGRLEGEG